MTGRRLDELAAWIGHGADRDDAEMAALEAQWHLDAGSVDRVRAEEAERDRALGVRGAA